MKELATTELYRFRSPELIVAGNGALDALGAHLSVLGPLERVLIVAGSSMVRQGFTDRIAGQLEGLGISVRLLSGIRPEPTAGDIEALRASLEGESFDAVIGIGGGSALDAAKLLSVLLTNEVSVVDLLGVDLVRNKGIPSAMIPSTSGTGSEVTPNAIVTLPEEELKIGAVSSHLLPRLVILDPELTLELPKEITAATGMDAFTHALESFISNKANPFGDTFALESIRLLSRSMLRAYERGDDLGARGDMLLGSMYGGAALTASGTAAVHALAYPLGGKFNIPHGVANAMLLPHVMEFNREAIVDRLAAAASAMGVDTAGRSAAQSADAAIRQIGEWTRKLAIPQDLRRYGVTEADLEGLAEAASKVSRLLNNNPKKLELADIRKLYGELLP
ncbi:iron-containing alcohol dehydrogenase [Cohnella cellulosilytica]|uniref:Iron-containing alcohol dehydrogenase n=1 Tax=Cohnella cellulosilytica TaxID=986710 RepID=A0ABW2F5G1_9BACL